MILNLDRLTANGVARLLGISRRQVQNLAEGGVIPKHGQFNTAHYVWDEIRDAYLGHKLAQIKPKRAAVDATGMAEAELRKLNAEATLAELKVAKMRSEVVDIEYVERCQARIYANVRARLLAKGGPGRIPEGNGADYGDDPVNCGLDCGSEFEGRLPVSFSKQMVGAIGFEPMTSTV